LSDIRADVDDVVKIFPVAGRIQYQSRDSREFDEPLAPPEIRQRNVPTKFPEQPSVLEYFDGAERQQTF
jgi:hypothetical protein